MALMLMLQDRALRRERLFRDRKNPFDIYSQEEFRTRYRLSKDCTQILINEVRNVLQPGTLRNNSVSPEIQLFIFLRFLASGQFYNALGDLHGVTAPTVCQILKRVSHAVASLHGNYINMPQPNDYNRVKREFYELSGFPGVLGLIDCTHIPLVFNVPPVNAGLYVNRKGFFSINVQVVSDSRYRIMNIVARWQGSVHDSRIWNNSRVCAEFEAGHYDGYLLGDCGYQCSHILLTPLRNVQNAAEGRYNRAHITTRSSIERAFGLWKRRFPILKYGMRIKLENVPPLIVALAVIHNIAINQNELQFEGDLNDEEIDDHIYVGNDNERGNVFRRRLIERVFV